MGDGHTLASIKANTVMCCCTNTTDECVAFVRDWCKGRGYTPDDVKIVKRDGMIMAESKRDLHGTKD